MKNRKTLAIFFAMLFLTLGVFAQGLYKKGEIVLKNGKTKDAYIQIDFRFPQRFQNSITYMTPDSYSKYQEKGKIKGKKKIKLQPKDIKGFNLDDGTVFKTVKYVDLTGRAIKMLPKKFCLEQTSDGKIKMFKYYSRTTGRISQELADKVFSTPQELIAYVQDNFQLLIQKDSKNPKNVIQINLLNFIGDNARVKENYTNNYYGLRNQFTERQKMGKYVNKQYEASFLKMLNDYNGKSDNSL